MQLLMALAPDMPKELHLLRVVDLPAIAGIGKSQAHLTAGIIDEAKKEAMDYMVTLTERLQQEIPQNAPLTISSTLAVDTDVAGAIIREAEEGGKSGEGAYQGYKTLSIVEPVVTIFLAALMLDETFTPLQLSGGLLILLAVVLLAESEVREAAHDKLRSGQQHRGHWYMHLHIPHRHPHRV